MQAQTSVVNDGGDEEEDETGKSMARTRHDYDDDDYRKKQTGYWCGRGKNDFGRAKQAILYPFLKAKKQLHRVNKGDSLSSSTPKSISSDKRVGAGVLDLIVDQGCCFCFTKLQNLDSKNGSKTSDPNDRKFTHDMLKVLIEKNDFYSKESNPHLDNVSSYVR